MSRPTSPQWNNEEARIALLGAEQRVSRKIKSIWSGFIEFSLRDSVLEVAVGLIIATSFTKVVGSLVSDVILPPLSLLPFMSKTLEEKFLVLKRGLHYVPPNGYNTREQALTDGAVIWAYGAFLDQITTFLGVGFALYCLVNVYGYFSHDSIIKHTTKCPYCRKEVSTKAKRCPMCTTWLDGREERESTVLPPSNGHGI